MNKRFSIFLWLLVFAFAIPNHCSAQVKKKKYHSKRDSLRATIVSRDSVMQTFRKSDTSINSLLRKIEDYTSTYNDIKAGLSSGIDTAEISRQLPQFEKRTVIIKSLISNDQSSTLRYLYAIRDFLTHSDDQLDEWQAVLKTMNDKLLDNENQLQQLYKDSLLRSGPEDSMLRRSFVLQRDTLNRKWRALDSINKKLFIKVGNLQNRVSSVYITILDETDLINIKIKNFGLRALSGDYNPIWDIHTAPGGSFDNAFKKTLNMNTKLFGFFVQRDLLIHLAGLLLFVLFFTWIYTNRHKILRVRTEPEAILNQAGYVAKYPLVSSLIITFAIAPNFYDHPPMVFLEAFFLVLTISILYLIKRTFPKALFHYLHALFWLTVIYSVSNLFIVVSEVDRWVILGIAAVATIISVKFLHVVRQNPEEYLPYTKPILRIFIALQALSFIFNLFGWFSLAKIIGVTGIYNTWLALGLYLMVQILTESVFLQLEANKKKNGISSYIDFKLLQQKFRSLLSIVAIILWLIMLSQNLSIEDAADNYIDDFLSQNHQLGSTGASFTFQSIIIFIAVIWLSSLAAKIISYLYDIAGQHDISVLKKKNRTSTLLIRLAVFSIGFFLAVAASGFPLDKITIIISAFGIGIGFGLQNIVNNLVSGLILAFEKPIQIGDIIEVDNRSGTIREIGIRSSKLATSDGAEVIIPNGDLISHHVINWTLSNSNRRVELIVGVAYGTDIDKVKKLLKDLLCNRDDIMVEPSPLVFLHTLNESSVDFRVLFWAADISTWLELKSRVLGDIYNAFNKEGIEIPYPTQDLNIRMIDKGDVDEKKEDDDANKTSSDPEK